MLERGLVGFTIRAGLLSIGSAAEGCLSYILLALVGAAVFFMAAGTNEVFADSALQHAPDAAAASQGGQAYSRQVTDSVSVASHFDNPASRIFASRTFARGISDGVSVASEFGGPAGQTAGSPARTFGPQQPTGQRIDSGQRLLLGNNKLDSHLYGTSVVAQSGTPVAVVATIDAGEMNSSELATLGDGSSDLDDSSSNFSRQIAAANSYIAMEKSMQNAALVDTSTSAVLLAGAIIVVISRQPAVSGGRMQRRMLALFLIKRAGNDYAGPNKEIVPLTSIILLVLAIFTFSSISAVAPSSAQESAGAGKSRIEISSAYHLDSDGRLVGNIYEESREPDGVWSEEIPDGHYVRVTFEQDLTSTKDITIYPRIISGTPRVQVYEIDGDELVAEFTSINSNEYNRVFLTNLQESQDTFDLHVLGGSVEFDYIVDPPPVPTYVGAGTSDDAVNTITPALPASLQTNDILLLFVETANQAVTVSNQNGGTWTEVTSSPQGTGTAGGTSATRLTVFWSRYNGSQGNPTVSDSGNHQLGVILAFRGVITTGNPWDVTSGNVDAVSNNNLLATGATTTTANTLVVVAAALMDDDQNFGATWTNANFANITVLSNVAGTAGNDSRLGIITGEKAAAGIYAATTNTLTANSVKGMLTIALKPEPFSRSISESITVSDAQVIQKILSGSVSETVTVSDIIARVRAVPASTADGISIGDGVTVSPGKSLSDSITTDDQVTKTFAGSRSISDPLGVSDSIAQAVSIQRSVSDTVAASDAVARIHSASRPLADSVSITDATARAAAFARGISDSVTVTDLMVPVLSSARSISDVLATTDAITTTAAFAKPIADTVAVTDVISAALSASRSVSDALSVADAAARTISFTLSMADAVNLADTVTTTEAYTKAITDSVAATDAIARAVSFARFISDSVTMAELVATNNFTTKPASDSLTVADAVSTAVALKRSLSDPLAVTDLIAAKASASRSATETLAATDAVGRTVSFARAIAEPVAITEEPATKATSSRLVTDSLTVADGIVVTVSATRLASDAFAVTDTAERAIFASRQISDALAVTDIASAKVGARTVSDAVTVTDAIAARITTRAISDSLTVTDAITARITAVSISDTLTATDLVSAKVTARSTSDELAIADTVTAKIGSRSIADSVTVADSLSARVTGRSASDAVMVADAVKAAVNFRLADSVTVADTITTSVTRSITDSVTVADTAARTYTTSRSLSESLSVADLVSPSIVYARTMSEVLATADSVARSLTFARAIADALSATDTVSAAVSYARSVADLLSTTDVVARAVVFKRSITDAVAVADAATRNNLASESVSEALTVADETNRSLAVSRSAAETLSITDAITRKVTFGRSVADAAAMTDTTSVTLAISRSAADSVAATDTAFAIFVGPRPITDEVSLTDSISAKTQTKRDIADTLALNDEVTKSVKYGLADAISMSDQVDVVLRPVSTAADQVALQDKVSMSVTRAISDGLAVQDAARPTSLNVTIIDSLSVTEQPRIISVTIHLADSLGIADSARPTSHSVNIAESVTITDTARGFEPSRTTDMVFVTDEISIHVNRILADAVSVSDNVGVVAGEQFVVPVADSLAIADAMAITSDKIVGINDLLTVGAALTDVSAHWNRNFSEEFVLGECTPFACNLVWHGYEELGLAAEISPQPTPADVLTVTDSIVRGLIGSSVPNPADSVSFSDSVSARIIGILVVDKKENAGPLPSTPVIGNFTYTGNPSDLKAQIQPVPIPINSTVVRPDLPNDVTILRTFHVPIIPNAAIPGDDAIVTETQQEVPALSNMFMRLNFEETPQLNEHNFIQTLDIEFTPKVDSTDFGLVVSVLDAPPGIAPLPVEELRPIYVDVRWVGNFPGAESPAVQTYYQNLPKFTFTVNEEWVRDQEASRDSNGIPNLKLWLLDESANQWTQITSITKPTAESNDTYTFVATLPHFSDYAITATKMPASSGGSQGGNPSPGPVPPVAGTALVVNLLESLAVGDLQDSVPIEVIEEFGQKKLTVRIADAVAIFTKPVSYRTFQVGDVEVRITVQDVRQESVIPPKATATFLVEMDNLGGKEEEFTLNFWYYDQSGKRPYESSQVAEIGPHKSRKLLVDVPFTEPGVFEVTAEARSIPGGDLANTAQLTVTIPWLAINLYVLVVVAVAILAASGGVMAVLLRGGLAGAGAGTALFLLARKRKPAIRVTDRLASVEEEYDIIVEVQQREAQGAHAVFDLEIVNRSGRTHEFMLKYWAADSSGIRMSEHVERVRIKGRATDVGVAQVVLPPGRNIFVAEAGPVSEKQARWSHAGVRVKSD